MGNKNIPNEIAVDGQKYSPAKTEHSGNREVIVVDRGWIFAGDATRENGFITLKNAVWVFRWESIGFDGVIANPKSGKITIKVLENDVVIPCDSEIFHVPVEKDWGL